MLNNKFERENSLTLDTSGNLTLGADTDGKDFQVFMNAAGAFMLLDESADKLELRGATAAGPGLLLLSTGELTNVDGGILGRIDFQAPLDAAGTDAILIAASIYAEADATFSASVNTTDLVFATADSEAATEKMRLDSLGNLGIGVTAFGTAAVGVIGITADGTVPSSSPAGMIQIFADDTAAGATTATLAIRTEEAVVTETLVATESLNIWINGTEYHWMLRVV